MASELIAEEISAPESEEKFVEASARVRGVTYHFRELSTETYDRLLVMSAGPDDLVDRQVLLKLMVAEASTEPKLTTESLSKMPYSVTRRFGNLVNRMHYLDEDEDEDEAEADEDAVPKRRRRS